MFPSTYPIAQDETPSTPRCYIQAIHVYIYARVSTDRQHTLAAQIQRCERYARRRGWVIVDRVREVGSAASSFTDTRPDFRNMVERALTRSINFDTVILVDEITRLSRHTSDAEHLISCGLPIIVQGSERPLSKTRLRRGIRTADYNSRKKSAAQKAGNTVRDKAAHPRGTNLHDETRRSGHLSSNMRMRNNILRAARCLADQPDLEFMTLDQICDYLTKRGVRRVMSVKKAREADWTVRELRRHWAAITDELHRITSMREAAIGAADPINIDVQHLCANHTLSTSLTSTFFIH